MSKFIQSANIELQKKQPSYFFGLRLMFPNQRTNASTNHDGCAEQMSRLSPTTSSAITSDKLIIFVSQYQALFDETQNIKTILKTTYGQLSSCCFVFSEEALASAKVPRIVPLTSENYVQNCAGRVPSILWWHALFLSYQNFFVICFFCCEEFWSKRSAFLFCLHYAYGVKRHSSYSKSDHNSSVLCTTFYTSCMRMHRCLPVILSLSLPIIWRHLNTIPARVVVIPKIDFDMIPKMFLSDTEMILRMYRWEFLGPISMTGSRIGWSPYTDQEVVLIQAKGISTACFCFKY